MRLPAGAERQLHSELRKRSSRKLHSWFFTLCFTPVWLLIGALAVWSLLRLDWGFLNDTKRLAFLGGAAGGLLIFAIRPMRPLYVFGHEMTHWLAAKLTRHRTGKFEVGMTQGALAVEDPTGFIALAPYFVPFYFLLSAGILASVGLVFEKQLPAWFGIAACCWLGLTYAYHAVLTAIALRHGQTDMEYCGKILSWAIILGVNLSVVFLVAALASPAPDALWRTPYGVLRDVLAELRTLHG